VTWKAARDLLPFGSGVGSFVPVYQLYETPALALPGFYINRAHNELLDVTLETGLAGLLLIGLFCFWLGLRLIKIWRADTAWPLPVDALLARAAGCAIVLVLAHSLVDYPLRTAAISAVFALACGMLVNPRSLRSDGSPGQESEAVPEPVVVAEAPRPRAPQPRQPFDITWAGQGPSQAPAPRPGKAAPSPSEPAFTSAAAGPDQPGAQKRRVQWTTDEEWPEAWRQPSNTKRDGDGGNGAKS
jgi:hypothetical protein